MGDATKNITCVSLLSQGIHSSVWTDITVAEVPLPQYYVDRTTTAGNAPKKKKDNSWLEPKAEWNVELYGTFLSIQCSSNSGRGGGGGSPLVHAGAEPSDMQVHRTSRHVLEAVSITITIMITCYNHLGIRF